MRSLDHAKQSWQDLKAHSDLDSLRKAVRLNGRTSLATTGGRSACWKAFLLFDNVDAASWLQSLASSRSAYNSVRLHFLRHLDSPDELAATYDPLGDDARSSPWASMRFDEELRAEILQDVERCMPENLYFRQPETQGMLLDILFVFCKLNPDTSYRQGMHELLAPILWVVERDAIDLGQSSKILGEDATIKSMFDADYIEHDTFALFAQVMQSAKGFYEQTTHSGKENPMVARSRKIFGELLPKVDPTLAEHLERVDLVPQVFLIRWIRLLFGREFAFDDMLAIWDILLAEDSSLELVDHICLAMILRIRWDLIDADLNGVLGLLLRYPEVTRDFVPQDLVVDALYLRDHMNHSGGSYLVYKYTGRVLTQGDRPATPPAIQRNITTFSGSNRPTSAGSTTRVTRPPRNIEAVINSTAKNLYSRGEKLGIGKAVRSAVDEVHKRAQEIRDAQTPSPPVSWRTRSVNNTTALQDRIQKLEDRSRQLGKLLEVSVGQLWEYQKLEAEKDDRKSSGISDDASAIDNLSTAIGRVQFVQVYLDDPTLPLPEDEAPSVPSAEDQKEPFATTQEPNLPLEHPGENSEVIVPKDTRVSLPSTPQPDPERSPGSNGETSAAQTDRSTQSPSGAQPNAAGKSKLVGEKSADSEPRAQDNALTVPRTRPKLEESSLSWMLGQETNSSTSSPSRSKARPAPRKLFGGQGQDLSGSSQGQSARQSSSGVGEETEFDLSSLRHGKGS